VFPAFMRSFYIRASFGYDLRALGNGPWYGDELFFGIGHDY